MGQKTLRHTHFLIENAQNGWRHVSTGGKQYLSCAIHQCSKPGIDTDRRQLFDRHWNDFFRQYSQRHQVVLFVTRATDQHYRLFAASLMIVVQQTLNEFLRIGRVWQRVVNCFCRTGGRTGTDALT